MIHLPTTVEAALQVKGEVRAGGTDLSERRHLGISTGEVLDFRELIGLDQISPSDEGGLVIGANLCLTDLAATPDIVAGWPAVALSAGGLATPQIRNRASLGGSLLQRVRCWYYRNPDAHCLKKGGAVCLARMGDHLFHVSVDNGACASPHPSTMAVALLAYDALVEIRGPKTQDTALRTIPELLGDGSDPRADHALPRGALLTAVHLPAKVVGERAAYFRTISRARAEWPLVEVVARLGLGKDGRISWAAIAVGAVANRPLRLEEVEAALVGKLPETEAFHTAAQLSEARARPLPMTGYKVGLTTQTVVTALELAAASAPVER